MEIPLLTGRTLTPADRMGSREVAVVNQATVRRFWGEENPIGRRFRLGGPDAEGDWIEVVGVVGNTQNRGLDVALHGFLQGLLFQVSGTDPMTFSGVTALLLGIGFLASYLPARRASRLDPVEALREE
jgi:hypothetical protein